MKNILILGSSGQIGSHLVNFLKNKKYNVLKFDIEKNKKKDSRLSKNSLLKNYIFKSENLIQVNKRNRVSKYFLKFWRPKTNLQEGINSIINYYKK